MRHPQIFKLATSLLALLHALDLRLLADLVKKLHSHSFLLEFLPKSLCHHHGLGLLRPEVRLVVLLLVHLSLLSLFSESFDLLSELGQVHGVVLDLEFVFVLRYNILLFLLPVELLLFELPHFLELLALKVESLLSLQISLGEVLHELLPLGLCVVVNFKRPVRSHELRIGPVVVVFADAFSLQRKPNEVADFVRLALDFAIILFNYFIHCVIKTFDVLHRPPTAPHLRALFL